MEEEIIGEIIELEVDHNMDPELQLMSLMSQCIEQVKERYDIKGTEIWRCFKWLIHKYLNGYSLNKMKEMNEKIDDLIQQ